MNPNRDGLLAALSERPVHHGYEETRALVRRANSLEKARDWLKVFDQFLQDDREGPLLEYLRYALLGLCLGFVERELSPYHGEHLEIVPPMLSDIRSVYAELEKLPTLPDSERLRYLCFDYGVHKAYYLDWTLYMSKECY